MVFIIVIEFENIKNKEKIINMFPKGLITNHAQCSFLNINNLVSVGVAGSSSYRNTAIQVGQKESVVKLNQN